MSHLSLPFAPSRARRSLRGALARGCLIALAVVAVLALGGLALGGCGVGKYNALVAQQEDVEGKWAQVENQYKRRFDLIPNLVETVKGAANFEQSTLTEVIEARAKVGQARLPDKLPTDQDELNAYIQAQQGLSGALGRLFALSENYPQLRATENFRSLQDQIEGTENRIGVARKDYVDSVQRYNTTRRSFPTSLVASVFGFEKAAQFEISEAEQQTPKVDFGGK